MCKVKKGIVLYLLILVQVLFGFSFDEKEGSRNNLAKTNTNTEINYFDGNRIFSYMENDGTIVTDDFNGNSGMYWPSRTGGKTINSCSGLWVAAKVNGEPRTAVAKYTSEWSPGKVLNGQPDDPDNPKYKFYKINRRDRLDPQSNPDWMDWPVDQGAPWIDMDYDDVYDPLKGDQPILIGDQMLWYVMNDMVASQHANVFDSEPLGLECRVTIWGYNRLDEIGDMMFVRFRLNNVDVNQLDSCYIGIWADVDLGDAADDFVGCDTTLGLGYAYNDGPDAVYGIQAPAIGYDFLQGPMVSSAGDSAKAYGLYWPESKNLEMGIFYKFIRGQGTTWPPDDAQVCWNRMAGYDLTGGTFTDPTTGQPVFPVRYGPGDPVTGTGWIDALDHPSGDRLMMLSSGPVTMAPGDSQEVIIACLIAQGSDHLDSITRLRIADRKAQTLFDLDFMLPPAPPGPIVNASGLDKQVLLTWDGLAELYQQIDQVGLDASGNPSYYTFQGYNVYQFEDAIGIGARRRLATYDIEDLVTEIKDYEFIESLGDFTEHTVQYGSDSGIQRYHLIEEDELRGHAPLVNNRPCYFAVTAYGYNPDGYPKTLESCPVVYEVYPQQPFGQQMQSAFGDSISVVHSQGQSDGSVEVMVVDPSCVTGHDYQVRFTNYGNQEIFWKLTDQTLNKDVLTDQTNQTGDEAYTVVDGLLVKVTGPDPDVLEWEHEGLRWLGGYNFGGRAFYGGLDTGSHFQGSTLADSDYVDVRIEFLTDSLLWQKAYVYRRDQGYLFAGIGTFPGQAWDLENQRQLNIAFAEDASFSRPNFFWDMGWDTLIQTYPDQVGSKEYLYIMNSDYDGGAGTYDDQNYAPTGDVQYGLWARGLDLPFLNNNLKIFVYPATMNTTEDVFIFSTGSHAPDSSSTLVQADIKRINIFPNPYFGANVEERFPSECFVRFTHLPPEATLRIFTLNGELIRTLHHSDGTQFETWDLRNEKGWRVASGMYLVHVDCGRLGQKILKLAVVMPEGRVWK